MIGLICSCVGYVGGMKVVTKAPFDPFVDMMIATPFLLGGAGVSTYFSMLGSSNIVLVSLNIGIFCLSAALSVFLSKLAEEDDEEIGDEVLNSLPGPLKRRAKEMNRHTILKKSEKGDHAA